jgi:acetolactate synthase I/II/III large subunit
MNSGKNETGRREMTGAEMVVQALKDNGVEHIFGYPGGAVLPIYDEIFQQEEVEHILVRHEQGAGHAAEGYARSTGKAGVMLVTSGSRRDQRGDPLQDALMDSIPLVCITGQVPTIADRLRRLPGMRHGRHHAPCTKHNWLVKDVDGLAAHPARGVPCRHHGRPGPVVVDIPKDIQFAPACTRRRRRRRAPATSRASRAIWKDQGGGRTDGAGQASRSSIRAAASSIPAREASHLLRELVELTGFPITSTLMGLGAYPASGKNWLGMLGMHGTYEANMAMHDCDVMICIGARFDDRITGRLDAFSPNSKKIHIDIDPSSINKNVRTEVPIVGDAAVCWRTWCGCGGRAPRPTRRRCTPGGSRSNAGARAIRSPTETRRRHHAAIRRPAALRADQGPRHLHHHRGRPAPDVGGAAFRLRGAEPLDDLRRPRHDGLRPAGGARRADRASRRARHRHRRRGLGPDDHAGDVDGGAVSAPIKIFILNNQYMGMVRQWQQLLHGNRLSHSYSEALPDFVKLAEAYGCHGIRCDKPGDLDAAIQEMIDVEAGDLRLPGRRARQLLPDDPVGQGAQRDAAARRGDRRGGGQCHRRQGQGAGVAARRKY